MALATPDHDRNLCEVDLARLVLFDECSCLLFDSVPFLNTNINLALNLISEISNPCLMWEIRIHLVIFIRHHWFSSSVNLTKFDLVTNVVIFLFGAWKILFCHTYDVALVLFDTVGDVVLDEPIETLNLLVYDSILLKKGVDDLPLVVDVDLRFSVIGMFGV